MYTKKIYGLASAFLCAATLLIGCSDDSSSSSASLGKEYKTQNIAFVDSVRIYEIESGVTDVKLSGAKGKTVLFARGNVAEGDKFDDEVGRIEAENLTYVVADDDQEDSPSLKRKSVLQRKNSGHSNHWNFKHRFASKNKVRSLKKKEDQSHEYTVPAEPQKQLTPEDIVPGKTTRKFKLYNLRGENDKNYESEPWLEVEFTARSVGENVIVWSISSDIDPKTDKPWTSRIDGEKYISETNSKITTETYDILRKRFESILDYETEMFGGVAKKIFSRVDTKRNKGYDPVDASRYTNLANFTNILVYDFAAVLSENGLAGYVETFDFFPGYDHYAYSSPNDSSAISNEGNFLYLFDRIIYNDPDYVLDEMIDPETGICYEAFSTMAHEFMHAIHSSRQEVEQNVQINNIAFAEMLAQLCEYIIGPQINVPNENSVVAYRFPDFAYFYENVGMLEFAPERESYSMGLAVGLYLLHNYGGQKLLSEMLTNPYDGWDAIINAIEKVTGEKLSKLDLMKHFMEAYTAKGSVYAKNMNKSLELSFGGKKYSVDGVNPFDFTEHGYLEDDGDNPTELSTMVPPYKEYLFQPLYPEGGINIGQYTQKADENFEIELGNDGSASPDEHLFLIVSDPR